METKTQKKLESLGLPPRCPNREYINLLFFKIETAESKENYLRWELEMVRWRMRFNMIVEEEMVIEL